MRLVVDADAGGATTTPPRPQAAAPSEMSLPLGLDEALAREFDRLFVQPRRLLRKEVLYRAGDPFSALHVVRAGTLKTVMLSEDGREQITGCHMAGDIVGLDGVGQPLHACDAIALEDSHVSSLPFTRLDELGRNSRLMGGLFQLMAREMRRNQELIMLLGSMRAEERLAAYLLNLSQRCQARGLPDERLTLSMTRQEIASFLGLQLETVSRLFSRLQAEGLVQVHGRAIQLVDVAGLRRLTGQAA